MLRKPVTIVPAAAEVEPTVNSDVVDKIKSAVQLRQKRKSQAQSVIRGISWAVLVIVIFRWWFKDHLF